MAQCRCIVVPATAPHVPPPNPPKPGRSTAIMCARVARSGSLKYCAHASQSPGEPSMKRMSGTEPLVPASTKCMVRPSTSYSSTRGVVLSHCFRPGAQSALNTSDFRRHQQFAAAQATTIPPKAAKTINPQATAELSLFPIAPPSDRLRMVETFSKTFAGANANAVNPAFPRIWGRLGLPSGSIGTQSAIN